MESFSTHVFSPSQGISMGDLSFLVQMLDDYTQDRASMVYDDHPTYSKHYAQNAGGWVHIVSVCGEKKPDTMSIICELCLKPDPTVKLRVYHRNLDGRFICQDCYDILES